MVGYCNYTIKTTATTFFLVSCTLFVAWGANFSSNTSAGAWTSSGSWSGGTGHPDDGTDDATISKDDSIYLTASVNYTIDVLTFNQNTALYIGPNATLTVSRIEIKKDSRLWVDGSLSCTGNIDMDKDSSLDIEASGSVEVDGAVDAKSDVSLKVDGAMSVDGDFTMAGGGAISGTGSIDVGGTVDIPVGSDPDAVIESSPLPIVLSVFNLLVVDGSVIVQWETLSELNNAFFTIERSTDGIHFEEIVQINGRGTTSEANQYQFTDSNPIAGLSYYRLRQTDFDGTSETFRMVPVQTYGVSESDLRVYPNPASGSFLTMEVPVEVWGDHFVATVTDLSGRIVIRRDYGREDEAGSRLQLDGLEVLRPGIYFLHLTGSARQLSRRFVKQ